MAIYPFCLVPFFPDPLCLPISRLLSPFSCHFFLPTSAVNLAHICPPVVLYHLVCLGLSLFLSRPPASCFTPYSIPPPSLLLYVVKTLYISIKCSLLGSISPYICLSLLWSSLPFCLAFFLFIYIQVDLILQPVFLLLHCYLFPFSFYNFTYRPFLMYIFLHFSVYYHHFTCAINYSHIVAQQWYGKQIFTNNKIHAEAPEHYFY